MPWWLRSGEPDGCSEPLEIAFEPYHRDMTAAGAEVAIHVRDIGHLSDRDIAGATGAAPSTVREWLNAHMAPSGAHAERLAELSSIVERLARVVRPTYIPVWLNQPMDLLDDEKPIERIAVGDHRAVERLISGLEDPGAA
jgi:transcriptional regulator with XRE-family HTH domain